MELDTVSRFCSIYMSQFDSLSTLADKFNPRYYDSRIKSWHRRIQFVLVQDELQGKIAEKDKLMEDLRLVSTTGTDVFHA